MVDLAQTITEWKDVEGNKVTLKKTFYEKMLQLFTKIKRNRD